MKSALIVLFIVLFSISALGTDFSQGIYFDLPENYLTQKIGQIPVSQLTSEDSAAIASYRFDADTLRVLGILVDWTNRLGIYSRETFDSMFFSSGVYPGGSIADYFNEVSYGKITITGDIIDWHSAGTYEGWFDFESILPDLDATIDFSQYDGDNDGNVDAVVFIRSGTGEEFSHDENDIWSYAMIYQLGNGPGPYDGVMIPRWNTSPELYPTRNSIFPLAFGPDTLNGIRVFCHELSHNLGLPDLYDYDDKLVESTYYTPNDNNDHPLYDWCLMGYGGYGVFSLGGNNSGMPSHLCGWSKKELGWIEPVIIQGTHTDLVLYDIETHTDSALYKLPINNFEGEYFLLEYRNPHSTAQFDKLNSDFSCYFFPGLTYGADSLDHGLIIMHVHDSISGFWDNNGTPDHDHYKVVVEDAGYNPSFPDYMNPEGTVTDSAQWWYPYETRLGAAFTDNVPFYGTGQELFSSSTTPSSDGYYAATGIEVRVDSMVGDRIYLYVHNPVVLDADGDGILDEDDNCPTVANADQFDDDSDDVGNACDNCPDIFSADQTNSDNDSLGNICDNCPTVTNQDQLDLNNNGVGDVCELDTVHTNCLSLTVKSTGRYGVDGYSVHPTSFSCMDFESQGDCADVYLFDGCPIISYVTGTGTVAYYDLYWQNHFNFPTGGNPAVPTIDSVDFEVYRSATVATADNALHLERIWYSPKTSPDSCNFIIARTMIFSGDGNLHTGIALGEYVDWDIPSASGVNNYGYINSSEHYVYQTGDGFGCQDNSLRAGMVSMLGKMVNGETVDTSAVPFNYITESMQDYIYPTSDLVPEEIYNLMQDPIPHALGTLEDQFSFITYEANATLLANDTLNYYTVFMSTRNLSKSTMDVSLSAALANAKNWLVEYVAPVPGSSCCVLRGDVNGDSEHSISDLTGYVDYLFGGGDPHPCDEHMDINHDGSNGISDLTFYVDYMFNNGPTPDPCE